MKVSQLSTFTPNMYLEWMDSFSTCLLFSEPGASILYDFTQGKTYKFNFVPTISHLIAEENSVWLEHDKYRNLFLFDLVEGVVSKTIPLPKGYSYWESSSRMRSSKYCLGSTKTTQSEIKLRLELL